MILTRTKSIIIALLIAIVVVFAGRYYALHDPRSKKDVYAAYLLGITSGLFSYLVLLKRSVLLPGIDQRTRDQIEAEMLVENEIVYPEPAIYEHEFYFNRWKKGGNLLLFLCLAVGAIYFAWIGRFIIAGLMAVPFCFIIKSAVKDFLDKNPQVKIAHDGIWVKGWGYRPWSKIRKISIRKDTSGRAEAPTLEIFLVINEDNFPDVSLKIEEITNWKDIGLILSTKGKTEVINDY